MSGPLRPALMLSLRETAFTFRRSRRRGGRVIEIFRPLADDEKPSMKRKPSNPSVEFGGAHVKYLVDYHPLCG